jgi:2-oxoglutarate ferredoxin oxidoreductase subunit beta
MVSGIGCSSRATGYVDFNTLHATHGRAIAFATGIKLANPDLTVIVATGDGDATAIGGNHLIHAARRNINLTVVLLNNWIYGMTGGQVSPTTPRGMRATTAPHGNAEPSFDIGRLAACAGASFVARASVANPLQLSRFIERGITKNGFALVEVFTPCPTAFGRQNQIGKPLDLLSWIKENTVDIRKIGEPSDQQREGKLITGVLADLDRPEYTEMYQDLSQELRAEGIQPDLPERECVTAWSDGGEGGIE